MKKLTTLIALIICVTVGGVYAAWMYTGDTLTGVDRTVSHGMATAVTEGDVGILSIEQNTVDIKIDQKAAGDYTANMIISGSVTIKFVPNNGAPDTVKDSAIPINVSLYTKNADTNKYEDTEIYVCNAETISPSWVKQNDGSFSATVTAEEIDTLLDLGKPFKLETLADYNAFHALEENITITLAVKGAN